MNGIKYAFRYVLRANCISNIREGKRIQMNKGLRNEHKKWYKI